MVPALIDNSAKLAINEQGNIQEKPHGHGDIHSLLYESGIAAKWRDLGKQWMMFIQDTNALALNHQYHTLGIHWVLYNISKLSSKHTYNM